MNIVNRIYIGDELYNYEDLTPEQKRDIAVKLNRQALEPLGYCEIDAKDKSA